MKIKVKYFTWSLAALIVFLILFLQMSRWHEKSLEDAVTEEQKQWWGKVEELEEEVFSLREQLAEHKEKIIPKEKLEEVFGEDTEIISPEKKEVTCEELENQLSAFFTYIDNNGYMEKHKFKNNSSEVLGETLQKLNKHKPSVTDANMDMLELMRNLSFFYRTLGKKDIFLINDILKNESEMLEPLMDSFFKLYLRKTECGDKLINIPETETLYSYAGFFLNTLAGKSYLLRRKPVTRILTSYYCVLIIDKANDETLNNFGIDIKPYLVNISDEITNQAGLAYKWEYNQELTRLKEKYRVE